MKFDYISEKINFGLKKFVKKRKAPLSSRVRFKRYIAFSYGEKAYWERGAKNSPSFFGCFEYFRYRSVKYCADVMLLHLVW